MRRKIAGAVLVLVLVLLIAINLWLAVPPLRTLGIRGYADYIAFYAAGRIVSDHQGARLYSLPVQMSVQTQLVGFANPLLPYTHLPFETLMFVPLASLPFAASLYAWIAINAVLLFVFAYAVRPYLRPSAPRAVLLLVAIAFGFWPVMFCLNHGQDSILDLLFFTAAFILMKKDRDLAAGACLGLALVKWQYLAPLLLLLVFRKQWKALGGFATSALVLGVISLSITGPNGVVDYLKLVRSYSGAWDQFYAMPSLYGLISLWVHGATGQMIALVLSLVALVLPATTVFGAAADRDLRFDLQFSLALASAILAGYHVYIHDLTLLLLPLAIVGALLFERKRWIALSALSVFFLVQFYWGFTASPSLAYVAIPVIGLAALLWTMIRQESAQSVTAATQGAGSM